MFIFEWMINIKIFFIVAAGLYYLAELVEEYTKYTAKVIKFLTVVSDWYILSIHYNVPFKTIKTTHFSPFQATLSIYVCLFLFEELTTTMILSGVAAQISHLFLLQNFPFFNLTSPSFLAGLFENVSFIQ